MLEVIRTPELAAQVTLMPVDAFGVDAAIVFSDILPPLVGMGLELDFVKGDGPRIGNPIASARDVDLLGTPPAEETMSGTLGAIALVRRELESRDIPVIGFAGAPFTLASYAIEGGTSKDFSRTKAFMLSEPAAWTRLLTSSRRCRRTTCWRRRGPAHRRCRCSTPGRAVRSGARTTCATWRRSTAICTRPCRAGVPVDQLLARGERVSRRRGSMRRRRHRPGLAAPARRGVGAVGFERPVQGNLDPASLLAPWRELQRANRRRPGSRCRPSRPRLQRRPRPRAADAGGERRRLVEHVRERTSR